MKERQYIYLAYYDTSFWVILQLKFSNKGERKNHIPEELNAAQWNNGEVSVGIK